MFSKPGKPSWVRVLLIASCTALAGACAPGIGDACDTALDCSTSGTRLCDLTQQGGYCTLEGCEEGACPDDAVCVQFGLQVGDVSVDRLNRTFCMASCKKTNDCRNDDGYECYSAESFGAMNEARILGSQSAKFCAPMSLKVMTATAPDATNSSSQTEPEDAH